MPSDWHLAEVVHLGSHVYRHSENGNTLNEYNFLLETSDNWFEVPKHMTNMVGMTVSDNLELYYAQAISVRLERQQLPDYYFSERGYVDGANVFLALATAEYYAGESTSENNFVEVTHVLGGKECIEMKTQQKINDLFGHESFVSHSTKFWEVVDSMSGLGGELEEA